MVSSRPTDGGAGASFGCEAVGFIPKTLQWPLGNGQPKTQHGLAKGAEPDAPDLIVA